MPRAVAVPTYDYSGLLQFIPEEKWCTTRYLQEKLDKSRIWVINRLWVAFHDGVVEYKEVINKRDRVAYAWRLVS
ncbi:hypothetical protein LCGC14_0442560 [marine sediment metagenome]|uniref:Uncharacterized protein n=1 Tax=marine sediment metagenome TaxID=412755 RepID=A0A0F9V6Y7_9ZZZZ